MACAFRVVNRKILRKQHRRCFALLLFPFLGALNTAEQYLALTKPCICPLYDSDFSSVASSRGSASSLTSSLAASEVSSTFFSSAASVFGVI